MKLSKAKFEMGALVATPGAIDALEGIYAGEFLVRHLSGDWGEVCNEDAAENEFSLKNNCRILSVYTLNTGVEIWIITEADRSVTTILLPEEY